MPQTKDVSKADYISNNPVYSLSSDDYSLLLGKVVDLLAVSLPNKQQHAAAVHTARKAFDETYFRMLENTFPNSTFGRSDHGYAVIPKR